MERLSAQSMMASRIDRDKRRYDEIVRGKVREDLGKYVARRDIIGKKGNDRISIPVPQIDTPKFEFGDQQQGVSQGDGEVGDIIRRGRQQPGMGDGAGNMPGEHVMEVDVELKEIIKMMKDELELPLLQPKGDENITDTTYVSGSRQTTPIRRPLVKPSMKRAIQIAASEGYDARDNDVFSGRVGELWHQHGVAVYPSVKEKEKEVARAVIFNAMDVSGSMGEKQKELARLVAWWQYSLLREGYKQLDQIFIIYDEKAKAVDEETFFHTRESGGTKISSAYELTRGLIQNKFKPEQWNIYVNNFTDGDNYADDNEKTINLITELRPLTRMMATFNLAGPRSSPPEYIKKYEDLVKENPGDDATSRIAMAKITNEDDVWPGIKAIYGKKKA